jgi:hypothetical protein
MLDAFIIEEIKRRERLRQEERRPQVEIPAPAPDQRPPRKSDTKVVIIDVSRSVS